MQILFLAQGSMVHGGNTKEKLQLLQLTGLVNVAKLATSWIDESVPLYAHVLNKTEFSDCYFLIEEFQQILWKS